MNLKLKGGYGRDIGVGRCFARGTAPWIHARAMSLLREATPEATNSVIYSAGLDLGSDERRQLGDGENVRRAEFGDQHLRVPGPVSVFSIRI